MRLLVLFTLLITTAAPDAFAQHPKVRRFKIDGTWYTARPVQSVTYCPPPANENVYASLKARFDGKACVANLKEQLGSAISTAAIAGCFKAVALKYYSYDEIQLLDLPKTCIEEKLKECGKVEVTQLGELLGILGEFLDGVRENDLADKFSKTDGLKTCQSMFYKS